MDVRSMSSSGVRANMLHLVRESSESSNQNVIGRESLQGEKLVHHWFVDKTADDKFTTLEMKGGA